MTPGFREEHKVICKIFTELAFKTYQWDELMTIDEFKKAIEKAKKKRNPATVIYMKRSNEEPEVGRSQCICCCNVFLHFEPTALHQCKFPVLAWLGDTLRTESLGSV